MNLFFAPSGAHQSLGFTAPDFGSFDILLIIYQFLKTLSRQIQKINKKFLTN